VPASESEAVAASQPLPRAQNESTGFSESLRAVEHFRGRKKPGVQPAAGSPLIKCGCRGIFSSLRQFSNKIGKLVTQPKNFAKKFPVRRSQFVIAFGPQLLDSSISVSANLRCSGIPRVRHFGPGRCPLYPRKRTLVQRSAMSALCQKRTLCSAATDRGMYGRIFASGWRGLQGSEGSKHLKLLNLAGLGRQKSPSWSAGR
jgi:hypothetical protein